MSGWFAVARGITSHHVFKGHPERLAVWMWLLDNAAWKDTKQDVKGQTITVPRGCVSASSRRIAQECGVGHQVVRTALNRFKSEHMINTKLTQGRSLITLCNYEKYQDPEKPANTKLTHSQHNANTQKKQGNNRTIEPKGSLPAKRLSPDWVLPREWGEWAVEQGWPVAVIREEAEKFRDYWISKAGRDAAKKDWLATWRNWMRNSKAPKAIDGGRNEQRASGAPATHGPGNRPDPALEQIARLAGLGSTQGNDCGGTGSHGQENGPFRMGAGPGFCGARPDFDGLDGSAQGLPLVGGSSGLRVVGS